MFSRHRSVRCALLVVLLAVLMTGIAAAAAVTLSAGTLQAQPGDTVEVPIQLSSAAGLGALHLEVSYDSSVLTAEDVTKGDLTSGNALLDSNNKQPGRLIIGIVSLDGIKGDGIVAKAKFKVIGDAGKSSDLKFQNNQAWDRQTHAEVLVNSQPGKVTIAAGLPSWLIPAVIAAVVLLLLLIMLLLLLRRRRPAPQPAYVTSAAAVQPPPTYAPPATMVPGNRPVSLPGRAAPPPPMDLPERGKAAGGVATNAAPFQHAEDEFFKLKGQLSAGRITQDQYDAKLRELMVQDPEGRYWMIGGDSGKWYVHDGASWTEAKPY